MTLTVKHSVRILRVRVMGRIGVRIRGGRRGHGVGVGLAEHLECGEEVLLRLVAVADVVVRLAELRARVSEAQNRNDMREIGMNKTKGGTRGVGGREAKNSA